MKNKYTVNYSYSNLQRLRKLNKLSQQGLSDTLNIKRSSLSGYENHASDIPLNLILELCSYFEVSTEIFLKEDLSLFDNDQELNKFLLNKDIEGKKLRILTSTVNSENEDNIELVPIEAKAGYQTGYADPDYIKVLPTFHLPFLSKQKKYRSFPISGDSMPPVEDGSFVTAEYLQNWNSIKDGAPYIVITKDDGIVFKIVYNQIFEKRGLLLCSTNPDYEPYFVPVNQIHEVWKFVNYISSELPEPNINKDQLSNALRNIQKDISTIKSKIDIV